MAQNNSKIFLLFLMLSTLSMKAQIQIQVFTEGRHDINIWEDIEEDLNRKNHGNNNSYLIGGVFRYKGAGLKVGYGQQSQQLRDVNTNEPIPWKLNYFESKTDINIWNIALEQNLYANKNWFITGGCGTMVMKFTKSNRVAVRHDGATFEGQYDTDNLGRKGSFNTFIQVSRKIGAFLPYASFGHQGTLRNLKFKNPGTTSIAPNPQSSLFFNLGIRFNLMKKESS